jgi:hypothetical protein
MSQVIQGTFANGALTSAGETSAQLLIPAGVTSAKLTTQGLSAQNTIKTQKRVAANGGAYVDQVTYNADQAATVIAVVAGEDWQIVCVTEQANTDIRYKLSCES